MTTNRIKDNMIIGLLALISVLLLGDILSRVNFTSTARAAKTYSYKLVQVPFTVGREKEVERILNSHGRAGWRVADWHGGWVILQK